MTGSAHPFLETAYHIRWSTLTPDHIVPDITKALEETTQRLDALARTNRGRLTFETTLLAFEDALQPLNEAWGRVCHLDSVCNAPELRGPYNEMLPKVTEFSARLYLNDALWDLFKTFSNTPEAAKLTPIQKRFLDETMADFRASGADLPDDKKKRLEELESELAQTTQKFTENVLDATNAWDLIITDEAQLAGLPATAKAAAAADAKAKGLTEPAWRFTLKSPSLTPVLEHLDDEGIRRQVWEASTGVGRDGQWDNTALIHRILELRREKASLLGKPNFADLTLERRMARHGARALEFVEDLHGRISSSFSRQVRELQEFKAEAASTPVGPLEPWDVSYWAEKHRKALYDFDEEQLRAYFPLGGVLDGMFRLCERLFAIQIQERPAAFVEPGGTSPEGAVEVWHPEVKFYEIRNSKGVHLGSFYADWHPRDAKRPGAWMNHLKTGRPPGGADGHDREPHLGLVCGNLTPSVDGKPALLSHREVETIFHEFGHLLHHLLGQVEIKSLNGLNVAWDFVELPSQIMENFCWSRKSLDFFARHHETGKHIPPRLFKKMIAARNYNSAITTMRQLALCKMDLELHINHAGSDSDLDTLIDEIVKGYVMPLKTKPPSIVRRFAHIFGDSVGYAAGYYSYKWAEVLDADCFSRFEHEGVLNPKTGQAFRDCILSKGNSEPPEKLFRDFMGRDPDLNALLARSGLA